MSMTTISEDDRSWAIYANAAGLLVFTNVPLANVLATLLVWLKVKNAPAMPFAREHAKSSFNFQATWTLVMAVLAFFSITLLLSRSIAPSFFWGFVAVFAVLVLANIVCVIAALVAASDLKTFRYPLAIPFLR